MKALAKPAAGALALGAALLLGGAKAPTGHPAAHAVPGNWNAAVHATDHDSFVLGNPAARVRLIELASYTCSHCAHFVEESDAPLKIGFVGSGKGSFEVRSFVRDPIDMTVALLTHCGGAARFFPLHNAFMRRQTEWLAAAAHLSPSAQQRWFTGPLGPRLRYIAQDLHLHAIMETQGFSHAQTDRCLANLPLAQRLARQTEALGQQYAITGTPSFLINGELLAGTSNWATLRPQLEARMD